MASGKALNGWRSLAHRPFLRSSVLSHRQCCPPSVPVPFLGASKCCPPSVPAPFLRASECCPPSTISVRSVPPFLRALHTLRVLSTVSARSVPPCLRVLSTVSARSVPPCLRVLSTVSAQSVPLSLRVLSTIHRQYPLRSSVPQCCPSLASGKGYLLIPRCMAPPRFPCFCFVGGEALSVSGMAGGFFFCSN